MRLPTVLQLERVNLSVERQVYGKSPDYIMLIHFLGTGWGLG